MKRELILSFVALVVVGGVAQAAGVTVQDVTDPRINGGWVTDGADVLSAEHEEAMNYIISTLEVETGAEVAVVTVPNVEGTPKEFATALFNHWRIGKADANNGLLVLLVLEQRRLEMETGYGLEETLPDGWLGQMQSRAMVPLFKQGDYGGGLRAGIDEVAAKLRENESTVREGSQILFAEAPPREEPSFPLWSIFGVGASGAGFGLWRWRRKRQRTCPTCHTMMTALDEHEDDEFLSGGQQTEEHLGSMDHEVRKCGTCGFMRTFSHWKLLNVYRKCSACSFKTLLRTSTVITRATTTSTGTRRTNERCKHCGYANSYTSTIPRISTSSSSYGSRSSGSSSRSSSSGSSSRSSGGGRSGGGGAGSSW